MKGYAVSPVALVLCALPMVWPQCSEGDQENGVDSSIKVEAVTIALNQLDMNDSTFTLRYTIKNCSAHEIWVCGGVGYAVGSYPNKPEVYVASDRQTLVIRQHTEISSSLVAVSTPAAVLYAARFLRIEPEQEREESLLLEIPIQHRTLFTDFDRTTDGPGTAVRVALEIGYFEGDLPGTIGTVLDLVDKLRCAGLSYTDIGYGNMETFLLYFRGFNLQDAFDAFSALDTSWKQGKGEILIPYQWPPPIIGERRLRISVEGVQIPYSK